MSGGTPIRPPNEPQYYLGCPIWGNKSWVGALFTREAKTKDYLRQYAQVFNSVEGNTSFYGIPTAAAVAKWREATPVSFRFAFKFPRAVSHEKRLLGAEAEVAAFLEAISPLGPRLGTLFLQLPPSFDDLAVLRTFLEKLPKEFRYAVEARHPNFYDEAAFERDFHLILKSLNMDLVIFDSHRLQRLETDDPEIRAAQRKKPKAPVRHIATGERPFLRFVGDPDYQRDEAVLKDWAARTADWIKAGKKPHIFMHQAPDDVHAPHLARMFHELLRQFLPDVPALPPWPGEEEDPIPVQLSLF